MGGDDGLLRLEENIRSLLGGETLKEASVRHLFRLLDEQIWKLNESAYVSCSSEEEQKAILSLLESHKEEKNRLKDSFRDAQRREEERKSRARQDLLGNNQDTQTTHNSQIEKLRAERTKTQKKTESLRGMIRLLRREMNQGASTFERLEESSKQLNETVDDQATLQDTLKSSSALLGKLKNKEFREKAYLCFSIFFFFFVVSLVWKQRVLG